MSDPTEEESGESVSIIAPGLPGAFWTDKIRTADGSGNLPFKGARELFGLTRHEFKAVRGGFAEIAGTYGTGYYLHPAVEERALTGAASDGEPPT